MSPILVRPVREQLEHDRVIRLLQVRLKRRADVAINIGEQQTIPVRIGQVQIFPDLVLTSPDKGHKLLGTVEVETAESVNHLEAMAQWAHLGRARAPFHLYVPAGSVDIARRLASENQVNVSEIWSYHTIGDQTRFTMVHRTPESESRARNAESRVAKPEPRAVTAEPRPQAESRKKTSEGRKTSERTAARPASSVKAAGKAAAVRSAKPKASARADKTDKTEKKGSKPQKRK